MEEMPYYSAAREEFFASLAAGKLPAVVPFVDRFTGETGLSAAGIAADPSGIIHALAFSDSEDDRAAAAVMACTNVARATEREHLGHCPQLSATARKTRTTIRVFPSSASVIAPQVTDLGFLVRRSAEPTT